MRFERWGKVASCNTLGSIRLCQQLQLTQLLPPDSALLCPRTPPTHTHPDAFDELRQQNPVEAALMPAVGGLTTGVLALGYPEILYQGFDNVNNILSCSSGGSTASAAVAELAAAGGAAVAAAAPYAYAPGLLIQIVVMKVIATAICRGSGLQVCVWCHSL